MRFSGEPSRFLPVFLVAATWVSVLSTDLYTPSLPYLPFILGSSDRAAQLTLSANLAAFTIAQIFHAPLADRYGRRTLLIAGMFGFSIASVFCAVAGSMNELIAGRAIQGLLSSVPSVVVLLLIRELYGSKMGVRILGFHGMAVGVAPIIGPIFGGFVFLKLGWRANFWMLATFAALVALAIAKTVPETLTAPQPLRWKRTLVAYGKVLGHRPALAHLLPMAASFGALFAFVTAGPFVFKQVYGVRPEQYGFYFGAVVLAAIVGGLVASRVGGMVCTRLLETAAFTAAAAGVSALLGLIAWGADTSVSVTGALCLFGLGLGLINATSPMLLLDTVQPDLHSFTSATAGTLQLAAATLASLLVSPMLPHGPVSFAAVMALLLLVGAVGFLLRLR